MQIKTTFLAALAAGTTFGRMHGHQRRHAQLHEERSAEQLEERQVGAVVVAVIDGKTVSWTNQWSGEPSTTEAPAPAPTVPTTTSVAAAVNTAPAPAPAPAPTTSAAPAASSSSSDPLANAVSDVIGDVESVFQSTLNVISDVFGAATQPSGSGDTYVGNVGNPWGSNIIQIAEENVNNFKNTIEFTGNNLQEPWIVNCWNKVGRNGGLTGFFGESALAFTVGPGEKKFVAIDDDSQGGCAAAPGGSIPTSSYGAWAATWLEFDMASSINNGWSGFDVSCIQAQAAGLTVQGMQVCGSGTCSAVTPGAAQIDNAYYNTPASINADGVGGNLAPGPVNLKAVINYAG